MIPYIPIWEEGMSREEYLKVLDRYRSNLSKSSPYVRFLERFSRYKDKSKKNDIDKRYANDNILHNEYILYNDNILHNDLVDINNSYIFAS